MNILFRSLKKCSEITCEIVKIIPITLLDSQNRNLIFTQYRELKVDLYSFISKSVLYIEFMVDLFCRADFEALAAPLLVRVEATLKALLERSGKCIVQFFR